MQPERSRSVTGRWRVVSIALYSTFLVSCTSTGGSVLELAALDSRDAVMLAQSDQSQSVQVQPGQAFQTQSATATAAGMETPDETTAAATEPAMIVDGEAILPEQIAYLPASNPAAFPAAVETSPAEPAEAVATAEEHPAGANKRAPAETVAPAPRPEEAVDAKPPVETASTSATTEGGAAGLSASAANPGAEKPAPKRGFLSSFFGSTPAPAAKEARKPAPIIKLASAGEPNPVVKASLGSGGGSASTGATTSGSDFALPGVRQGSLFEIKRKSGLDDDSDIDVYEDEAPVRLASAAGFARLAPNGLLKQTDSVDVGCLKPSLVRVLKSVERHYGKKVMVTSGYRNASRNRRARGAKNSLHMYCAAADIQVQNVSKWQLANYLRSMPGRGGVGTYCHTNSVHVDVGPERDWNWRCRRRRK